MILFIFFIGGTTMIGRLAMARAALSICFFLAVLAATVGTPAKSLVSSQPLVIQKAFRPYGYYSLVGKAPKGFEKFDTIQYWRKDQEQSGPDISERTSGVNETGGVVYRYTTISITRQRFVFTTAKVKGISYSFSGRFLRTDFVSADLDMKKPVLVGMLSKYKRGKKVAEANVELGYFAGT
jgi:hypothetical protein